MTAEDLTEFLAWVYDNYVENGDDNYIAVEEYGNLETQYSREEIATKYLREVKGQDV